MADPKEQNYGGLAGAVDITKINPYGVDDARLAELRDAQQKSIEALQNRYDKPNWFKVAAGFAKPQLGGFLASLGSASEALGENVEQQRAQQLPISQMKIQMAQQNILLGNKQKAASIVAQAQREGRPLTPKELNEITNLDESRGKAIMESQASQLQQKSAEQRDRELLISQANALRAANLPVPKWLTDAIATQPTNAPSMMNSSQAPQTVQGRQTSGESPTATPATQTLRAEPDLKTHSIATDWQMPIPTSVGTLTSPYGSRTDPITGKPGAVHNGWDIGAPQGTPIQTVGTGKIKNIQTNDSLGNSVTIDHGHGYEVRYSHLDSINPDLKIDNAIQQHQLIGNVGSTGRSTGPHLDMTVFKDGKPIDPAEFFGNPWKTSVAAKETVATPETTEKPKTEGGYYPQKFTMRDVAGKTPSMQETIQSQDAETVKSYEDPLKAEYAKNSLIYGGNTPALSQLKSNLKSATDMILEDPTEARSVLNIIRDKGPIVTALNEGIQLNAGQSGVSVFANLRLPIDKSLRASLLEETQNYQDSLFGKFAKIAYLDLKKDGVPDKDITSEKIAERLKLIANPDLTPLGVWEKLSRDSVNLEHEKNHYDIMTHELNTKANPNSPTKFSDVRDNSKALAREAIKAEEKYAAIDREVKRQRDIAKEARIKQAKEKQ